jgi:hypothetical protein
MTNNRNILLENFLLTFAYDFTDQFDNELYVFRVSQAAELAKIKKEIKKMKKENLIMGFTYEKDDNLFIKLKKQHIKKFNKFKFEKGNIYKTHLNLVYYDYKEKQGYYATMTDTTEEPADAFD